MQKKSKRIRYKNTKFLEALGRHCQQFRNKKGYSIDQMYREGNQLSSSSIHRLENGTADTQISVFYRYAQVLGIPFKELFDFEPPKESLQKIIPYANEEKPPRSCIPFYDIRVAAGKFSEEGDVHAEPDGWFKVENHRNTTDFFVTQITGQSMEPTIPDGSLCLFKFYRGGSRQNKIFLIRSRGLLDPETQEAFVVKKYRRMTNIGNDQDREDVVVHLISENKNFPPIILMSSAEKKIEVLAEFIEVID